MTRKQALKILAYVIAQSSNEELEEMLLAYYSVPIKIKED